MVEDIEAQGRGLTQGVYDIDAERYHTDPTPQPSLSSSGIKRLLSGSPAEFAAFHPRLTQWPELCQAEATRAQDRGTIIHSLVLGKGAGFHACDPQDVEVTTEKGARYKNWSGKAADWKRAQEAQGIVVMSRSEGARVQAATQSMIQLLQREYGDWPIGDSEQTIIWQRETEYGPIWCRALVDHLALRHMVVLDPKSTALGISDRALQRIAANDMWHIQAAWYLDGIKTIMPHVFDIGGNVISETGGRLVFRFVVVEIDPPYQSRFVDLPESWIHIAGQRIDRACEQFAKCLYSGEWPAHSDVCSPSVPSWMQIEFETEEAIDAR
jgi:hypothetical protein